MNSWIIDIFRFFSYEKKKNLDDNNIFLLKIVDLI